LCCPKKLAKNIDINLANDNITKLTRIGKKLEGEEKHRPLLVTFSNDDIKRTNFKNFVRLRSEDEVLVKTIYMSSIVSYSCIWIFLMYLAHGGPLTLYKNFPWDFSSFM
jgi:hypothetical protein